MYVLTIHADNLEVIYYASLPLAMNVEISPFVFRKKFVVLKVSLKSRDTK